VGLLRAELFRCYGGVVVEGAVEVRGVMKKDEVAICKGRISISTKNRGDVDATFKSLNDRSKTP
jgi:hypothetical protein